MNANTISFMPFIRFGPNFAVFEASYSHTIVQCSTSVLQHSTCAIAQFLSAILCWIAAKQPFQCRTSVLERSACELAQFFERSTCASLQPHNLSVQNILKRSTCWLAATHAATCIRFPSNLVCNDNTLNGHFLSFQSTYLQRRTTILKHSTWEVAQYWSAVLAFSSEKGAA
jgi:hypothetical protein